MLDPSSDEESSDEAPGAEEQELLGIFKGTESSPGIASPNVSPRGSIASLHNKTPSPTPSVKSTVVEAQEDEERKEKLQLYVFVLRCIAHPFNARQPTDMVRRHTRVSKQNLQQIRERFRGFLNRETKIAADEAFYNSVRACYDAFICSDRIAKMVASGGCSANDFREVFKSMIEKRVRNLPEISGLSKETVLSSWMAKFDAIYRGEEDVRKASRIATSAASELILSKEQLYEMFQTILGVKRYEHQILYNACQLDNPDEQAACIRRELQGRVKALVTQRKCLPAFLHKDMESLYVEEQQTAINQLMGNLESLPVTKGSSESKYSLYKLTKVPNSISMVEVADDTDPTLSKTDVVLSFMIEIVIAEAQGLKSLRAEKKVYCTMEVEGGEKLQTLPEPAAKPLWGTKGDFTTCHPRPVIKVKLFLESTGVLALDDKELGRVTIKPAPGGPEAFEWRELTTSKGWSGDKIKLKISVKMDKPVNLKKCGYIFARGKTVWKKWKKRFLVLVQVSQYTFAVCSYGEKKTEPSEMMQLDGYTVDYCDPLTDEDCKGGRFFFKGVKEGDQVVFATEEDLERQIWVNKLYTATGQSHKPVAPKLSVVSAQGQSNSLTRLQGDADKARKLGLDELILADPCIFDHMRLFEMLQRLTLTHRLSDSYSCLGWFSPGQLFVLDEYCSRYGVRSCHRHVCYLSDLLDRAEAGVMIDPTLLHYSFAFCAAHVHGNRPDGVGTITVEERAKFGEIKDRLWNMLSSQITQFRYSFPFGRPEGALKATLSLFERVMMKDIATPVPSQEFRAEIRQCLQKAALVNYTRLSAYAKIEEFDKSGAPPSKRLEDIMHLAELCIDLLQQNEEHHAEALAWVSDLVVEHQELFWSLFSVDMQVALKVQPADSWDSFQLFQLLNEYLRNDANMNQGAFHNHLKEVFAPLVIRYIDLMESSIAQSVHKGFEKERWVAVCEGCEASKDLFWKLSALQKFIGDLNWPDKVMADHLMSRLKLMAADMVQSCVDRTKETFERWLKTARFNVDLVIPIPNCIMLNVLTQAKKQSKVLCSRDKADNSEYRYHADVHFHLKDATQNVLSQLVAKLASVLTSLLSKVARYDQDSLLASVFTLKSPGTEMEDSFLKFVKCNLDRFRTQLNNANMKAKLVKEWYTSMITMICDWLSERMNMALHLYQVQTLLAIITDLPRQFGEDSIAHKVLYSRTYHTVCSRLQVEHSMIKDGHVNMQQLEESANLHEADDEDDDDDESQSSDDAA